MRKLLRRWVSDLSEDHSMKKWRQTYLVTAAAISCVDQNIIKKPATMVTGLSVERMTRLELATSTLARLRSTR